jgi:hypothetical protein
MTIAELHQQLTELCNKGYGGAKITFFDAVVIDHAILTTCFTVEQIQPGQSRPPGWVFGTRQAAELELQHGETFLMLE